MLLYAKWTTIKNDNENIKKAGFVLQSLIQKEKCMCSN